MKNAFLNELNRPLKLNFYFKIACDYENEKSYIIKSKK